MMSPSFSEKIGYGFGDMASSMFWKIFSYYLPFFYSNILGLRLNQVAALLMVTRIWDAVSDPFMGIVADRTRTKWGKYRPYIIFMSLPFAICGVLLFTVPTVDSDFQLVWAYLSYILMMTVYTGINVPYGAMLGVMTDDSHTKTIFSSYRMLFAYVGSFLVLFCWEPLSNALGGYNSVEGWRNSMMVVASICLILFLLTFIMTKERVNSTSTVSVSSDLKSLVRNLPWWLLVGAVLCSNLFNTVRGCTVAYYFKDVIGDQAQLTIGSWTFLFYAGLFLGIGEACNMIGVAVAPFLDKTMGKKSTFIYSFISLTVLSVAFFFVPVNHEGYWMMIALQIVINMFTGIVSPLVWSMFADISDYSEYLNGSASTGLIFSSSSMTQKFGGAFGGALVMLLLASFGYDTNPNAIQSEQTIFGVKLLMSIIPAAISSIVIIIISFYPLSTKRMKIIQTELQINRQ